MKVAIPMNRHENMKFNVNLLGSRFPTHSELLNQYCQQHYQQMVNSSTHDFSDENFLKKMLHSLTVASSNAVFNEFGTHYPCCFPHLLDMVNVTHMPPG